MGVITIPPILVLKNEYHVPEVNKIIEVPLYVVIAPQGHFLRMTRSSFRARAKRSNPSFCGVLLSL
jgi:hypothetical protein